MQHDRWSKLITASKIVLGWTIFHSLFWYLRTCRRGHGPVFIAMSLAWWILHDCLVSDHLLGLHRPENNNASQNKDYQSPVSLRQLGIIFKLYSFPQNLRQLNLRTLNINLLSNLYQPVSTSWNSAGVVIQRLVQWECNWHFNVKTERSSTVRFP